ELQLWINGVWVIYADGLIFREDEASYIKGMHFQTFFYRCAIASLACCPANAIHFKSLTIVIRTQYRLGITQGSTYLVSDISGGVIH
ncbi:uncharacterized protein EDB91DRAFT_1064826, partial [Suillus paluster]|uniref:uncharacterized protein n=1 Tax=Suillus paluster TaxID=48578 RepID=UPI001B87D20C